jgi:hypothetical protein
MFRRRRTEQPPPRVGGSLLLVAAHWTAFAIFADAANVGFVYLDGRPLQLQVSIAQDAANLPEYSTIYRNS